MADFVFNIAKGKVAYYAGLPAASDVLRVIVLEASGLEADGTLKDYDNVSALLAGSTNEQTTMGRKSASSVTVTVNDTTNRVDVDMADITWTSASGNAVGALIVCYDASGSDADTVLLPLTKHDFTVTPNGTNIVAQIAAGGFYGAT